MILTLISLLLVEVALEETKDLLLALLELGNLTSVILFDLLELLLNSLVNGVLEVRSAPLVSLMLEHLILVLELLLDSNEA